MICYANKVLRVSNMAHKKASLTCQSKKVCIVIRKGKEISIDKIKSYCETCFSRYAFIEHKNHLDLNGNVIPVHYHIVGDFFDSKVAFSTRLNTICAVFGFENADGVEIDKYDSLERSIQYLTHKNQPEKTQMNKEDIITNIEKQEFELLYTSENGEIMTFDRLFALCYENLNIIGVIQAIGIGQYKVWRNVIWDIFNNIRQYRDTEN